MASPRTSNASTSSSSCDCSKEREAFIASLDLAAIQTLALKTRQSQLAQQPEPSSRDPTQHELACTVQFLTQGGSNVLYDLRFSAPDNSHWVIRIPLASRTWTALAARRMHHDVVAQQYILARTAVPIPRIHASACSADNALGHPYVLMDFVEGTRLVDVWNEPGWWMDGRTRERTLESLACVMVELATLEFPQIGCLELPGSPGEPHGIVPFPSLLDPLNPSQPDAPTPELEDEDDRGPFTSTHAYLSALLAATRAQRDDPTLALLQLLLSALPSRAYDRAPFTLGHPDFDAQNVFLDARTGAVAALVDWDGVAAAPRELGALTYPMWLTVDWDPFAYAGYRAHQPHCDGEETLRALRRFYTGAVDRASGEGRRWGRVTRNSHLVSTLEIGITNELSRLEVVYRLGKYVFGSGRLVFEMLEGIEHCAWYNRKEEDVAEVIGEQTYVDFEISECDLLVSDRMGLVRGAGEGTGGHRERL
ncbi:hypothetical protein FKP32DRAFT_525116 [Trametes sanguinea]|nr:hypothetical protein FKP32DRAFT_525116 [Trametes sanguinea]